MAFIAPTAETKFFQQNNISLYIYQLINDSSMVEADF